MTVPIHLITGFLGSGKTTLLNSLLRSPEMADSAVLINEFGETAVDHLLVDSIDDDIVILESGCVCCSVRDDLPGALMTLQDKQARSLIPPVRRVVLETTGIADPLPICQQVMSDPELIQYYRNGAVITLIDGVYGHRNIDEEIETVQQIVIADHIVISKSDLADHETMSMLQERIKTLNSSATVTTWNRFSEAGDLRYLFSRGDSITAVPEQRLNQARTVTPESVHTGRFQTFTLHWEQPVAWEDVTAWLEGLLIARGEQIFRLKGLVHVTDRPVPVAIQGVRQTLYPPRELGEWPGRPGTSLVFITRDLPAQAVAVSIAQVMGIREPLAAVHAA